MKTLREYIDILDEINRRDFLRGAGAAAVAGAAAGLPKIAQAQTPPQDIDRQIRDLEDQLRGLYRMRDDMRSPPQPEDARWGPGFEQLTYKGKIYQYNTSEPPQGSKGPIIIMPGRPGIRSFGANRFMLLPDGRFYWLGPVRQN